MSKYLLKLAYLIVLIIAVSIIFSYFDIHYNLIMKDLVDKAISGNVDNFLNDVLIMVIYIVLFFIGLFSYDVLKSIFLKKVSRLVKGSYIKRLYNKNLNEFQSDNNSLYLSALTNDYEKIELNFFEPILESINMLCTFGAGIILISIIDPIILLVGFGLMIINVIISAISSKPVNKHNLERSKMLDNFIAYIKEVLGAFHIIKTNNLEEKVKKDYFDKSKKVQDKGFIIDRIQSFIFTIQNTNFGITYIGLFLFIAFYSIEGYISFGAVVLIVESSDRLIWSIARLVEALPKIFSVKSLHKKMEDTLKNKTDYQESINFNGFNKDITFSGVKFCYDDDNQVLDNVNLQFEKGKKYLIVGPSGGGKSTILRLLRKYFNPQDGEILVDGVPLKDIYKQDYFSYIANIEQNVFLFEDTIRNNLTLYKDIPEDKIYEVLHKAGLDDFIESLPKGIETMIYDNGKNISGGERSRLAIARGLINDAQIIFLDEAFANLDYDRAKEIERSILAIDNITLINVSHVVIKENQNEYDGIYVIKNKQAYTL